MEGIAFITRYTTSTFFKFQAKHDPNTYQGSNTIRKNPETFTANSIFSTVFENKIEGHKRRQPKEGVLKRR